MSCIRAEDFSGYLSPYKKPYRVAERLVRRHARDTFRPKLRNHASAYFAYEGPAYCPNPTTVVVIRGEDYEGMVGVYASKSRCCPPTGNHPIERCEILISATNKTPFCFKPGQWEEGTLHWVDCENIDWYDLLVEEEKLFHCADARMIEDHKCLMYMYDLAELKEFKRCVSPDSLPGTMIALIDKYWRKEEEKGTNEWYWRQAKNLLRESKDYFWEFSIEEETVSEMSEPFKTTVLQILSAKQRAEDEECEERQKRELHRSAILAVHNLEMVLNIIREFEEKHKVRMMMPDADDEGNFERVLPHRANVMLENMIGGLQQVGEATPDELSDMVEDGKGEFSRTECAGCGDKLGGGQCDSCFTGDGNKRRRPATVRR